MRNYTNSHMRQIDLVREWKSSVELELVDHSEVFREFQCDKRIHQLHDAIAILPSVDHLCVHTDLHGEKPAI